MTRRARRVLIVEDDATLRETLAEILSDEGHDVRVASHGLQAVDQLLTWDADLIILDLMMPTMDAFAFREHQRRLGVAPAAKTLILSAARDLESAAARLEADAWIAKPFHLAEVLATAESLMAGGPRSDPRPVQGEAGPEGR